jgi:uncharacterized protein (DUF305 family)
MRPYHVLLLLVVAALAVACDNTPPAATVGIPPALTTTPATPPGPPIPDLLPTVAVASPFPVNEALDQVYIDTMIPHHQLALDMAGVALQHAEHGEIRSLARDIQVDQADEIRWFRDWRAVWWPRAPSPTPGPLLMPGMPHAMPGMDVDLAALAAAQPFDKAWIDAMIPHHQAAIDMSTGALAHLTHPELRDKAQDIAFKQQIEIARMETLYRAWYAEDAGP